VAGFHAKGAYLAAKRVQNSGKSGKTPTGRPAQPLICPDCGGSKIWKAGLRHIGPEIVQRWICRTCGYRFSSPDQSNKKTSANTIACRVCVSEGEMKNLAAVEPRTEKWAAGATTADTKSLLFNLTWWMKKQGYADQTIEGRVKLLKILAKRGADLHDPEKVKEIIAKQNWGLGRKENAVDAYSTFLKMTGGSWDRPRYKRVDTLPWVPTEIEIDQLIAGCSARMASFLQLLKETGMRPGEAWQLKWIDADFEKSTVNVTPEKGSNPRNFKISGKLIAMLRALPQKSSYIFRSGELDHFAGNFRRQRRRTAFKLKNPRIDRISFKTLRHFKGTMEYHRTKDILHVMNVLGHKNIKNTLVYTHLVNFETDDFSSRVAKAVGEACALVEAGFEYVTGEYNDGGKIFRKRK